MKRIILILVTALSMCCLVACGVEKASDSGANGSNIDEPVVTEAPVDKPEVTPAPAETTPEPEEDATPAPTEDPYFEINNSDLIGVEWIESFVGTIDEAKVVVYSLETGRKEIIEKDAIVKVNPEKDILAVYLPEGYKYANRIMGIFYNEGAIYDHSEVFYLDVETTWEKGPQMAAVYVEHNDEEIALSFVLVPEE